MGIGMRMLVGLVVWGRAGSSMGVIAIVEYECFAYEYCTSKNSPHPENEPKRGGKQQKTLPWEA